MKVAIQKLFKYLAYYIDRFWRSAIFILLSIPFFFSIIVIPFIIRNRKMEDLSERQTKIWFKLLFKIFGIKLKIIEEFEEESREKEREKEKEQGIESKSKNKDSEDKAKKFLIYANHISFLDIPSIILAFENKKIKFLAKEEVLKIPVIGWGMAIQKHPVIRKSKKIDSIIKVISLMKDENQNTDAICIFPEGTRGDPQRDIRKLLPFEEGVGFIVERLKIPIIPVAIIGTHEVYPPGAIIPRSGEIKVVIGRKINDVNDLIMESQWIGKSSDEKMQDSKTKTRKEITQKLYNILGKMLERFYP
jgi:1-acyl-sn-glycerol-3-phosphate acyltransferase